MAPSGAFLLTMLNTILGTKSKMTQAFVENRRVPVTVVSTPSNVVTQVLTEDKNGYWGAQLAMGTKKAKNTPKPLQGHFASSRKSPEIEAKRQTYPRYLREVRLEEAPGVKAGDTIAVTDVFTLGDMVAVTGISKGKGFAGGVKRWGFAGGSKTHGQSDRHRAPGSIGQGTDPGRVWKGKKMAGRMGNEMVTVKNLTVVAVDGEKQELHLSGPVPGTTKSLLVIKRTSSALPDGGLEKQGGPDES